MSKYFEKTKSLLLVFLGKIRLVGYTLISSVLFHLSSSLVSDTPHWIIVLIYLLTFWNSIMKLINLRMLSKNAYPQKFIDKCIKKIRNNVFINRPQIPFRLWQVSYMFGWRTRNHGLPYLILYNKYAHEHTLSFA